MREDAWCLAIFAGLGEKAVKYEKVTLIHHIFSAEGLHFFFPDLASLKAACGDAHRDHRQEILEGLLRGY